MLFAFGPNETYFFDDGNGNRKWRVTPEFDAHMASRQIGKMNGLALGEDGAFFISYTTLNGLQHMNEWQDPKSCYLALWAWLSAEDVLHGRSTVYVSLGMRGSFFAASSQGHRWRNISESLQDYYQKFTRLDLFTRSRVNTVDLGVGDTFLGIGVDGTWFWDLEDQYPELSTMIGQKGMNNAQFAIINPFAANQHVVILKDRSVHWSLPPLWIQDMQDLFKQYANKAGAHIPPSPIYSAVPQRPTVQQPSSNHSGSRWRPSWSGHSGNATLSSGSSSPPMSPPTSPPVKTSTYPSFDWNQAMGTTQSVLDAWNTAQGQNQYGASFSSGGMLNSGLNGLNNANSSLELVNNMTSNGVMIGQLAGQFAGAAAACNVM